MLAAHRAFVAAGAEIVISASYQAPDELLAKSVRVARRAGVLVAASVGPTAPSLAGGQEYTGDYDVPGGWHERRCASCSTRSPDCLAIETQPRADEAAAIAASRSTARLLGDVHVPRRRAHRARRADRGRGRGGGRFFDAVAAVGVNCTAPEFVDELLARSRTVTDLPLVAYPNAGRTYDAATKTWSGARHRHVGACAGGCGSARRRPCRALAAGLRSTTPRLGREPRATHSPSTAPEHLAVVQAVGRPCQNSTASAAAGSRPSAAGAGPRPGTARRPRRRRASSHSRSGITSLCADAHAPSCEPRGRLAK